MAEKKSSGRAKRKKKGIAWRVFIIILFVAGAVLSLILLFRHEADRLLKPKAEKQAAPQEKRKVVLYFSDDEGEYLIGEQREILRRAEVEREAKEVLTLLARGPRGVLLPTLPPQTKLRALRLDKDGVAVVDFSQDLSKNHPGGSSAEVITVYSIVNSLTLNFPEIKRVQILIQGREIETLAGHLALKQPISSKRELIRTKGAGN